MSRGRLLFVYWMQECYIKPLDVSLKISKRDSKPQNIKTLLNIMLIWQRKEDTDYVPTYKTEKVTFGMKFKQ